MFQRRKHKVIKSSVLDIEADRLQQKTLCLPQTLQSIYQAKQTTQ